MNKLIITGGKGNPLSLSIELIGKSTKETSSIIGESLKNIDK